MAEPVDSQPPKPVTPETPVIPEQKTQAGNPERSQIISEIESRYRRSAEELRRLGLNEKAEEILKRIPTATEITQGVLDAQEALIQQREKLYAVNHPESNSLKEAIIEEIAQVAIDGNRKTYDAFVDIPDDNPDREALIQFAYDSLGVDRSKRKQQGPVGGPWGDGTTIVESYTAFEAENDRYVIIEARDWPVGKKASTLEHLRVFDSGKPLEKRPQAESNFTRVFIHRAGADTNRPM